jgi:hypothetical protein
VPRHLEIKPQCHKQFAPFIGIVAGMSLRVGDHVGDLGELAETVPGFSGEA